MIVISTSDPFLFVSKISMNIELQHSDALPVLHLPVEYIIY